MTLAQWKDIAEIIQSIVTVGAIVVGGLWFFRRRLNRPWARVKNHVEHRRREDGKTLLHVTVHIDNIGQVLLRVAEGFVRIQQVLPSDEEILREAECDAEEIPWPSLAEKRISQGQQEIEPGEDDERQFDFVLEEGAKSVIVYTHIRNLSKRDIGWNATTLYDISPEEKEQSMAGIEKRQEHNLSKSRPPSVLARQGQAKPQTRPVQSPKSRAGSGGGGKGK